MNTSEEHKADLAYTNMCTALGHAISVWSDVESHMAAIFAVAMRTKNYNTAIETFYAATSFDAKLKLLDTAVRSVCQKDRKALEKWTTMYNRLNRKKKKRNKLAHGKVYSIIASHSHGPRTFKGCWFIPYFGRLRRIQGVITAFSDEHGKKLSMKDLEQIADGFEKLSNDLQPISIVVADATGDYKKLTN